MTRARASQRVGCEHPVDIGTTRLTDPSDRRRCIGCGVEWMLWPRTR